MRLVTFLLLCCSLFGGTPKEDVKTFTQTLSDEQRTLLDRFLRTLVKSFSGYVLYGDKPMCIETCPLWQDSDVWDGISEQESIYRKGMELWQDLKISLTDKEYFFTIFDVDYGCRHLVCIHREAFLQAVNENLSLFQYVLGPTLTAESLLQELIEAKDQFYNVLKADNVLLGILLGYGKQNALLVARKEYLSDAFAIDRKEDFPFLAKALRMHNHRLPKAQQKRPSLGFASLAEESIALKKRTSISRRLKPFDTYKIPHFGCESNSEESKKLLMTYEQNRTKLIQSLEKDDFLEKTLLKLFTTTSQTLAIPVIPKQQPLCLPKNKEELVSKLVQIIHQGIKAKKNFQEDLVRAFFEGVTASENNEQPLEATQEVERSVEPYLMEKILQRSENLTEADTYFDELSSRQDVISLIPRRIYYKIVQSGNGASVPLKVNHISFHYSFSIIENNERVVLDTGTVKEENIEHFIPGIVHALIGMKCGEEREFFIHPEYGYGETSYLPPNVTIIAKIQVINFEEGDREVVFLSPHHLERVDRAKILADYEKSCREQFYANGVHFWDFLKKGGDLIDFQTFQQYYKQESQSPDLFENEAQKEAFLSDLFLFVSLKSGFPV
jgi:FKBP-type peptidyl-prolyl cis-trans isomerase